MKKAPDRAQVADLESHETHLRQVGVSAGDIDELPAGQVGNYPRTFDEKVF